MEKTSGYIALELGLALLAGCSTAGFGSDSQSKEIDVEPPVITFKKDKFEVKVGDSYNVATNIKSVIDDQDGKLEQVMKLENGKAGYIIESEQIKEAKAGTFSVEVTAVDSAGNKAKSSFDVVVSEAKTEEKTDTEKTFGADKEEKKETSSAKSGNSDKVTSSSTAKPSTGNSSSSGSKPSSGTSNSASTSKPSAGSSGSNKPSTGGSSSGSGSAAKPSGGSGGGSAPAPKPKPDCKDVVVVDKEAWDEKVLVKDAYDEQVLVKDAWDETVVVKEAWSEVVIVEPEREVVVCRCGAQFATDEEWWNHSLINDCDGYYVDWIPAKTTVVNHPAETTTVHHDAEYKTVHHDAEYKTVHHDAVTHVVQVCS